MRSLPPSFVLPLLALLGSTLACYVGPDDEPDTRTFHADPSSIDFGYVAPVEFSEFVEIALVNGSASDVAIEVLRFSDDSDSAFSLGAVPQTLPTTVDAGDSVVITVAFAPPTSGVFLGTIEIETDSDEAGTVQVNLGGCSTDVDCTVEVGDDDDDDSTGDDDDTSDDDDDDTTSATGGDIDVDPTSVSFGDVPQNQNPPGDVVVVSNTGSGALVVSSVQITGPNAASFVAGGFAGGTLQPNGAPANLNLSFNAAGAAVGPKTATLVITSNDPDEGTVNIALTANVTEPCIEGPKVGVVGAQIIPSPIPGLGPPEIIYLQVSAGTATAVVENVGCDTLSVGSLSEGGTLVQENPEINVTGGSPLPLSLSGTTTGTITLSVAGAGCEVINFDGAYGFTVGVPADATQCIGGL